MSSKMAPGTSREAGGKIYPRRGLCRFSSLPSVELGTGHSAHDDENQKLTFPPGSRSDDRRGSKKRVKRRARQAKGWSFTLSCRRNNHAFSVDFAGILQRLQRDDNRSSCVQAAHRPWADSAWPMKTMMRCHAAMHIYESTQCHHMNPHYLYMSAMAIGYPKA